MILDLTVLIVYTFVITDETDGTFSTSDNTSTQSSQVSSSHRSYG